MLADELPRRDPADPARTDAAVEALRSTVAEAVAEAETMGLTKPKNLRERTVLAVIGAGLLFAGGCIYARPLTPRGNAALVGGALGVVALCVYLTLALDAPRPALGDSKKGV
jgi:hypothetical protein